MRKFNTQIVILSTEIMPCITPILDEEIRPEKVILCVSDMMKKISADIVSFLVSKGIETAVRFIGNGLKLDELRSAFQLLAEEFKDQESVGVNLSSGSKLMTIAAQSVFYNIRPCFYVIPQKDVIIMLNEDDKSEFEIQDYISLPDFFAIHGYKVLNHKKNLKIDNKSKCLFDKIFSNYDRHVKTLGKLNYLAARAEGYNSLTAKSEISPEVSELLQLFWEQGSIKAFTHNSVEFSSEMSRDYCKGFWLEDYAYLCLEEVDAAIGLQDFACSVEISSESGTPNEIDAAFLFDNTLYIIECKTARMDSKGTDVLYKIDTLKGYAGLCTKTIVATFKPLTSYDHLRADDLNIKLIEGNRLNMFAEEIISLIKSF